MSHSHSINLSLRDLLGRVSFHLDGLASEVRAIEHAIGDEMGTSIAQTSETITRLQRLDFLRQSLEDMALLSNFLSKKHDGILDEDLAQQMRLDATKALVKGGEPIVQRRQDQGSVGEVDLF